MPLWINFIRITIQLKYHCSTHYIVMISFICLDDQRPRLPSRFLPSALKAEGYCRRPKCLSVRPSVCLSVLTLRAPQQRLPGVDSSYLAGWSILVAGRSLYSVLDLDLVFQVTRVKKSQKKLHFCNIADTFERWRTVSDMVVNKPRGDGVI